MKTLNPGTLGFHIARLRRARRLTQRELAERLHTDHSMVTRWENGKVLPRPQTIDKIAEVLGVSLEELTAASCEEPLKVNGPLEDADLVHLLTQLHLLDCRDREAIKAVLEAMLTRTQLKGLLGQPTGALQHP